MNIITLTALNRSKSITSFSNCIVFLHSFLIFFLIFHNLGRIFHLISQLQHFTLKEIALFPHLIPWSRTHTRFPLQYSLGLQISSANRMQRPSLLNNPLLVWLRTADTSDSVRLICTFPIKLVRTVFILSYFHSVMVWEKTSMNLLFRVGCNCH